MTVTVNCPTCDTLVTWSEAFPYRPFCCKRCQLTDFGAWATEKQRIIDDDDEPIPSIPSNDE